MDRGRHDLDATGGNYGAPKYNSHPDQHGDQSQSLDQLAAGCEQMIMELAGV